MRIFERLQYLTGLLYFASIYYSINNEEDMSFYISRQSNLSLTLIGAGYYFEGIRLHQVPFIAGLLYYKFIAYLVGPSLFVLVSSFLLLLCSIILNFLFGESDFQRIKMTGPYQVGYRQFRTTKLNNEVSVFYPISKEDYKRQIGKNNVDWFTHGEDTLRGIIRFAGEFKYEDAAVYICRFLLGKKMDVVNKAEISKDFMNKPIIPIVYCHGLNANRTMYSGSCRDFASHGYMVFILDHKDGSNTYYQDHNVRGYFENRKLHDFTYRKKQLGIREEEIKCLVDEIEGHNTMMQKKLLFNESIKLDLSKLIMTGHSFGGITAIAATKSDQRVKACLTLDPWLYVYLNDINEQKIKLNVPFLSVSTERFHPFLEKWFPSWVTLQKLVDQVKDNRKEHVLVKKTGHLHQCDMSVIIPLEIFLSYAILPDLNNHEAYMLMSKLCLSFLNRIGFNNSFDATKVEKLIASVKKEKLSYDVQYESSSKGSQNSSTPSGENH